MSSILHPVPRWLPFTPKSQHTGRLLPPSFVHLLPLPPAAFEFVFRTWLPPSRVPESRRGERGRGNQSGIIGDAALSTANERPVNHRSVRASEKQAEVNPLSSSSITVATCECLLLRSLPRPPPSPPACTPCSSPNPSPSVGCLAARDRRFRCALTEFGPGFGLEAFDSCGCFPSAVWVQRAVLQSWV